MDQPHEEQPKDETYIPRLVNVDISEWKEFQKRCGSRNVSKRIRELVREDNRRG